MHASTALAERIDALLPQTQCTRCGFPACRPYADAIAAGEADINHCPPGGQAVLAALAALLDRPAPALDTTRGVSGPLLVARIDEGACIGCTLCIQACPVDAIIGAQKRLHGILPSLCSGCELCIAPCPVDCITMEPAGRSWEPADAQSARMRFRARAARIASQREAAAIAADARQREATIDAAVTAALARARARRAAIADS